MVLTDSLLIPLLLLSPPFATAFSFSPRHSFPSGDRAEIIGSEGFARAVRFLDELHEERYGDAGSCPILGPAWEEHDGEGPQLPPSPMGLMGPMRSLAEVATSYSYSEQRRADAVKPLGESSVDLSSEFAATVKKKSIGRKGFGSGAAPTRGKRGSKRRKKWSSEPESDAAAANASSSRPKARRKWASDESGSNESDGNDAFPAAQPKRRKKWSADPIEPDEEIEVPTASAPSPEKGAPSPYSLFDGNLCHVTKAPIFTDEECRAIIAEAERDDLAGSEWKSHDQYYKDMHITKRIQELPHTREFFGRACIERIFPLLQKCYPSACPQGPDGLREFRIFSAKVLRYDSSRGDDYLGVHHDGSLLTFLIGLNDLDEYDGGGTYFEALGKAVRYGTGHLCCHPGIVRHGGDKVERGVRYVLAAWIDIHGVLEYDRQLCEEADLIRMSGRLDQTLRYDPGASSEAKRSSRSRLDKAERWYLYSLAAGLSYGRDGGKNEEQRNTVPELSSENAWLGLGQLWLDQGRPADAADAFRNALDLSPFNVRAWISYGLALVQLNDTLGAMHAFRTASDMSEHEFDALSNLGLLLSMMGRHEEAADHFERAIGRIQQGSDGSIKADKRAVAELYTNLGVTLCDLGRFQESMVVFAKAVVIDPTFVDAARNLKAVRDAVGSNK